MKSVDSDRFNKAEDSLASFLESPIFRLNLMDDEFAGKTIEDRYIVEKELGRTPMSQVYLARDRRLQQQPVVIKILSQTLVRDEAARQRFERELKVLLHLDHPNVVRVQDSGELADGRPYFVMPYIDGETLRSQIPGDGMELERAAAILKQIGAALDHVHEKEVFHRDLKPENIMLKRSDDAVVLIDFGIAKSRSSMLGTSTADGETAGTLVYMSPEQLNGQRITAASDIYSTAVVAYEMLTGRRPFKPNSPSHLIELQRAGVYVRPMQLRVELSPKADRTITRALSVEPKRSYKTAGEFADKLAASLVEEQTPAKPVSKWAKVAVSLVILALLSFGVFKYCTRIDGPPAHS